MDQSNYIANQNQVLDFAVLFTTLSNNFFFSWRNFIIFGQINWENSGLFWFFVNSIKISFLKKKIAKNSI